MSHKPLEPFEGASGPRNAKIALVGEAWGEQEQMLQRPFVGSSGQELTRMLRDAGIDRKECFLTNVLNLRPSVGSNDLGALCCKKADLGAGYPYGPISMGKYLREDYLCELDRLFVELREVKANIVVALGNTACWALLGSGAISKIRGNVTESARLGIHKVLPTYHPAAIIRAWNLRTISVADLMKAKLESEFAEIRRPHRWVMVEPSLDDITWWYNENLLGYAGPISIDIETAAGMITHVGFATAPDRALCIKFRDRSKPNFSYWSSVGEEMLAWAMVIRILALPNPKLFQNGLYDISFFIRMGLKVVNPIEDTMLRHHAMFIELQKGLGFLGSIYTNESSWKLLRGKHVSEEKADDE